MATTCQLVAKNVLGSDTASVTFSSIPGTSTDLLIVASVRAGSNLLYMEFNGNSQTIYSGRYLEGSGSAASSYSESSQPIMLVGATSTSSNTSNTFGSTEIYIPNYAGSTNKSVSAISMQETNATTAYMIAAAGLWASTSAITSIKLQPGSGNFISGSSFFLYGITKA